MNKLFSKRICAYLIDILLLYFICVMVGMILPVYGDTQKYTEEINEILSDVYGGKELTKEVTERTNELSYNISKATYLNQIASISIYILYFVVYQKIKKGQTIGKKIMKIKISKLDNSEIRYDDLLKRGTLLYGFLINIVVLGLLLFASKGAYFMTSNILNSIQMLLFLVCIVTTIFAKQGIQDKFSKTLVEEC